MFQPANHQASNGVHDFFLRVVESGADDEVMELANSVRRSSSVSTFRWPKSETKRKQ